MKVSDVNKVKAEMKRLAIAIKEMEAKKNDIYAIFEGSKYSGAVKRASMDLTRALADMRHPWRKE